jgi:hypothetical protein
MLLLLFCLYQYMIEWRKDVQSQLKISKRLFGILKLLTWVVFKHIVRMFSCLASHCASLFTSRLMRGQHDQSFADAPEIRCLAP